MTPWIVNDKRLLPYLRMGGYTCKPEKRGEWVRVNLDMNQLDYRILPLGKVVVAFGSELLLFDDTTALAQWVQTLGNTNG